MSHETKSPGIRALEALDKFGCSTLTGTRIDLEAANIIERETGVTELRQQADELAKALEEMISRDDHHFYDGPTPIWITEARAALAAFRKDKP